MSATATWNDTWIRLARAARVDVLPMAVVTPTVAGVRVVLAGAKSAWPVKTRRSSNGLAEQESRANDLVASVSIVDPVSYTLQVHKGESWRTLVSEPMARLARELASKAGARAVDALRRR